jgi:hypothetical protein
MLSGVVVSFSGWSLIETLLGQDCRKVVDVQAVTHTGDFIGLLNHRDVPIAVVIAGSRGVKNPKGFCLAVSAQFHNFVTVLCFSSISVVHISFRVVIYCTDIALLT